MTWHRPADYVIATGLYYSEDEVKITYALAEVPRDLYPLGAQVTLKRDLPLMVSRTDDEVAMTLQAGESAVVAATDDVCWIYIVPEKYADDCLYTGGWVRMPADGFAEILVDGESVPAYDVMDGLLYAD